VDRDIHTGNKLINDYEILEELGRGEHGKVKLGRHVVTNQRVAIKIVQRYSKRRRLGKLGNPEDKVKREVAILKKARHPNVVSLLEVIDDPNRQKVYIVLEYVENGEIVWRKKGLKEIVAVDKRRLEREKRGIPESPSFIEESQQYVRNAQMRRRQREKARERRQAQARAMQEQSIPAWSLEHGGQSDDDDDEPRPELTTAQTSSRTAVNQDHSDVQSSPSHSVSSASDSDRMRDSSLAAIEGSMYGPYADYPSERRFSSASSNFGYASSEPDWLSDDDDMSYVPCMTISEARNAFRDSVLGLEYLHYQGIIHRDIKPANLLVTANHRVKISDFGVSYLGRPIRDDEEEQVSEADAAELDDARELSKTVGTPAFYAPELCYTGDFLNSPDGSPPKITGAIDVWSLGVTLYGMIFGRLPFVSDDEFSMFQTIVKNEVFIPRKRLKPVEIDSSSTRSNRVMNSNKRLDDELVYEDIDDELYDLLQRLLTKDPTKRITIKEIKHHPWVLRGIDNPKQWIEETDPGYQSKGKKIEVSNEEVTTAVSKVPFIQRVRSNVAKWSGYIVGRSREGRKRAPSTAASDAANSASTSSGISLWRDWRDGRRGSLRGDEETHKSSRGNREGEHPLSQSVTASPEPRENRGSYFNNQDPRSESTPASDRTPRPDPPQRTLSSAESTKTVRPSNSETTSPSVQPRAATPTLVEVLGASSIGGIFSGAGRRLARGLQSGEWRSERSRSADRASVEGDGRSEPSLALSVTSATGEMQTPGLWRPEAHSPAQSERLDHSNSTGSGHFRHRSSQLTCESPADSFKLAREALLHQRKQEEESDADDDLTKSRVGSETFSSGYLEHDGQSHQDPEWSPGEKIQSEYSQYYNGGLTTSPPSAVTISSSSADDFTSGMSQSASHPSIPSVVSGASSLSGDGFYSYFKEREKEIEAPAHVPPILRTGDTVKTVGRPSQRPPEDDESRYYCDDEEDDESEDEGIVFGRKSSPRRIGKAST